MCLKLKSIAVILVPTGVPLLATYVGMVVEWPCFGVHITASMALLVCVLCQPVDSSTEPALHRLDFLKNLFMETCF